VETSKAVIARRNSAPGHLQAAQERGTLAGPLTPFDQQQHAVGGGRRAPPR